MFTMHAQARSSLPRSCPKGDCENYCVSRYVTCDVLIQTQILVIHWFMAERDGGQMNNKTSALTLDLHFQSR